MALNNCKCNRLMPLHFKGLNSLSEQLPRVITGGWWTACAAAVLEER